MITFLAIIKKKCVFLHRFLQRKKDNYNMELKGKISQIIGAVVDVTFPDGENLPDIYTALSV